MICPYSDFMMFSNIRDYRYTVPQAQCWSRSTRIYRLSAPSTLHSFAMFTDTLCHAHALCCSWSTAVSLIIDSICQTLNAKLSLHVFTDKVRNPLSTGVDRHAYVVCIIFTYRVRMAFRNSLLRKYTAPHALSRCRSTRILRVLHILCHHKGLGGLQYDARTNL